MKKRGEIEVQFNWILVLVAGAVLFLFFFGIINWAKQSNEESSSTTISTYFDSILTASAVKEETLNQVTIPAKQITFTCNGYRVNNAASLQNIRNKIIFAPTRIEGAELITWSASWNVPFRVTNFLMVTSPNIRYILRGSSGDLLFEEIQDIFPAELQLDVNPPTIEDENNYKVRFLYANQGVDDADVAPFKKYSAEDITALTITGATIDESLALTFHAKKPVGDPISGWASPVESSTSFARGSLLGALFTEDPEHYVCAMNKGLSRLNNIAQLYKQRSEELKAYYFSLSSFCESPHFNALTTLDAIAATDMNTLAGLSGHSFDLISENQNARSGSCALIY